MTRLDQEITAARYIRDQLELAGESDPELIAGMIEGETNLNDAIAQLVFDDASDSANALGISELQKALAARKARIESRIERRREILADAMAIGEIKKLQTPAGTISLRAAAQKLLIDDEALVPEDFKIPQPAKLDKLRLKSAIADGMVCPGAHLSNGDKPSVSIRR